MEVQVPAFRRAEVKAKHGDLVSVVVPSVLLDVVEEGREVIPDAQHPSSLHVLEVRRRCLGHGLAAVLQEVLRSLDPLSQRHVPIADVRGYDAGRDEVPSLAPHLPLLEPHHLRVALCHLLPGCQQLRCVFEQALRSIEGEGGGPIAVLQVRRDRFVKPCEESRALHDLAVDDNRRYRCQQ